MLGIVGNDLNAHQSLDWIAVVTLRDYACFSPVRILLIVTGRGILRPPADTTLECKIVAAGHCCVNVSIF